MRASERRKKMSESVGVGAVIRKIISFIMLIAAAIALVAFFFGAGPLVFDPFKAAIDPTFDFWLFSSAIYNLFATLAVPLILAMLGLIGLTVKH